MNRATLIVLTSLALGCGGSVDSKATDSATNDGSPTIDPGPACSPIVDTKPFGVGVQGDVIFEPPATDPSRSVGALLLFPHGRVAGAPVILVQRSRNGRGFVSSSSVLDANLGASGLRVVDPNCGDEIDAALVGPDDGLVATVKVDFSAPSDALELHSGHTKLCATGRVPPSPPTTAPTSVWPQGVVSIASDLPIDPLSKHVRVAAGGVDIAITSVESEGILSLFPISAFPPNAKSIEFDLSGVRDVLGRPLAPAPPASIRAPTGAVVVRTFDVVPPSDAMLSERTAVIEAGAMWWKGPPGPTFSYALVDMLALGSEPGATTIRLRHRFECAPGAIAAEHRAIVSSDGKVQPLTVGCSPTFIDETFPLPGAPPHYLLLQTRDASPAPCNYPFGGPTHAAYVIDEMELK